MITKKHHGIFRFLWVWVWVSSLNVCPKSLKFIAHNSPKLVHIINVSLWRWQTADVDLYESAWLGVISQRISEPGIPKYQLKLACKHWFNTGWVVFYSYRFLFLSLPAGLSPILGVAAELSATRIAMDQNFSVSKKARVPAAFHGGVPMVSQPWRFCSHTMHRQVSPLRVWVVSPLMIVLAVVTWSEDDAWIHPCSSRSLPLCASLCAWKCVRERGKWYFNALRFRDSGISISRRTVT